MGYIYCITNKINGKLYVGKTENTIDERWREHCNDYLREHCEKRPLYDAMLKYGIDNFEIKELEYLKEGGKLLSDREIYWIKKLDTYHKGYNATKGGDGSILYDYDEILDLYKKLGTIENVCKNLGCNRGTVTKILNNNNIDIEKRKEKAQPKVVELYSLDNNLLNTFNSAYLAGKYLKEIIDTPSDSRKIGRNICRCASGERKTAYGYIWKYKI